MIVLSGVLKKEITVGTRKLEKELTRFTIAMHTDPKLPIYHNFIFKYPKLEQQSS